MRAILLNPSPAYLAPLAIKTSKSNEATGTSADIECMNGVSLSGLAVLSAWCMFRYMHLLYHEHRQMTGLYLEYVAAPCRGFAMAWVIDALGWRCLLVLYALIGALLP